MIPNHLTEFSEYVFMSNMKIYNNWRAETKSPLVWNMNRSFCVVLCQAAMVIWTICYYCNCRWKSLHWGHTGAILSSINSNSNMSFTAYSKRGITRALWAEFTSPPKGSVLQKAAPCHDVIIKPIINRRQIIYWHSSWKPVYFHSTKHCWFPFCAGIVYMIIEAMSYHFVRVRRIPYAKQTTRMHRHVLH